ncbi:MAG: sigma-70 family RNA polymerase sigma factor [Planctomycetes bacterium]|nr:sigma-70 family RNA polymerase sigma factor [Planctomycetota bacterium]
MTSFSFDLEQHVARHGAALKRLASALLGDPAAADDVVQEAWLRAVRRPPRHESAIGGWLSTLVKNAAGSWRRDESLRSRRQDEVARQRCTIEDHAATIAREEQARLLIAAIAALEPPYRDAIWQRYFEGLRPRDMARVSGEPLATIKSRLRRGLQLLRAKLGTEVESDWRPAMAMAFGLEVAATGAMLMTAWVKVIAVVIVLGAGLLLWTSTAGLDHDPKPEEDRVAKTSTAAGADFGQEAAGVRSDPVATTREAASEATAEANPKPARITGRVLDAEAGLPLAAAEVRLTTSYVLFGVPEDLTTRTDVDGRFELAFAASDQSARVIVGRADAATAIADLSAMKPGQVDDLGEVRLRRGRALRGRFVDESGAPVRADLALTASFTPAQRAGAWQEFGIRTGPTQGEDTFVTTGAVPFGPCGLAVSHGAHELVAPKRITVGEQEPEELVVVVRPRPGIRGTVVDELGNALAGIGLSTRGNNTVEVTTAADGSFELLRRHPSEDPSTRLFVADVGPCDPHPPIDDVAWGTHGLRIALRRSTSVAIEVVDGDGAAIEGFGVVVDRPGWPLAARAIVRQQGIHAAGRLVVEGVVHGRTSLRIVPTEEKWTPSRPIAIGGQVPLRIVLQRRVQSIVRVCAAGEPIGSAVVDHLDETSNLRASNTTAITDAQGFATLWRDVGPETRALRVTVTGRPPLTVRPVLFPGDGPPLQIDLPAVGRIIGRVALRGRDRQDVLLRLPGWPAEQLRHPDGDGTFASAPVFVGEYVVALQLRIGGRFIPIPGLQRKVVVVDADATTVDFDLSAIAAARARGRVLSSGALPEGLTVDFHETGSLQVLGSSVVGADRTYSIDGLVAGEYRAAFRLPPAAPGLVPAFVGDAFVLIGGDNIVADLTFVRRRLTLRFTRRDGSSAASLRLRARCGGGIWPQTLFAPVFDGPLVLDPAPSLPIEFGSGLEGAPWSAPVQMPQDRRDSEVLIVLPG